MQSLSEALVSTVSVVEGLPGVALAANDALRSYREEEAKPRSPTSSWATTPPISSCERSSR